MDALHNLRQLRAKVDHHSGTVMGQLPEQFACTLGCVGCCQTERTVSDVEWAALEAAVGDLDEQTLTALKTQETDACPLLLDGGCAVYEERPLICRSHGLPIVMDGARDVCPLNFEGQDLEELPDAQVLSVDTLTAILVAVNALYCTETGGDAHRRRAVGALLR
jgi:hypothetical protein